MPRTRVTHDGARIARLRQAHKWSLAKLADLSGVERSKIWRIEHGITKLTTTDAQRLAAPFGVSMAQLFKRAAAG